MGIEAQLPGGTVLEFPDGTPDAVIDRVVRQHLGVGTSRDVAASAAAKRQSQLSGSEQAEAFLHTPAGAAATERMRASHDETLTGLAAADAERNRDAEANRANTIDHGPDAVRDTLAYIGTVRHNATPQTHPWLFRNGAMLTPGEINDVVSRSAREIEGKTPPEAARYLFGSRLLITGQPPPEARDSLGTPTNRPPSFQADPLNADLENPVTGGTQRERASWEDLGSPRPQTDLELHGDTSEERWRKFRSRAADLFSESFNGYLMREAEQRGPQEIQTLGGPPIEVIESESQRLVAEARQYGNLPGQQAFDAAAQDLERNAYHYSGTTDYYAANTAESLVQMLPVLAAAVATRGRNLPEAGEATGGVIARFLRGVGQEARESGPSLGVLYEQQAGQQYGQSRAEGRTVSEANQDATVFGFAEAIPEAIPLGVLMRPGGRFLPRFLQIAGAEGLSEVMTQAVEDGYTKLNLRPDMGWGDAWRDIRDAGIIGSLMGGGMTVVEHPFHRSPEQDAIREIGGADISGNIDMSARAALRPESTGNLRPPGVVESARPAPVTAADEASPLPTDAIAAGKQAMATAAREVEASGILDQAGYPGIGRRVAIDMGNGVTHHGRIEDAFTTDDEFGQNSGVRIRRDDGSLFEEYFPTIKQSGIRIYEPRDVPEPGASEATGAPGRHRSEASAAHGRGVDAGIVNYLVHNGVDPEIARGVAAGVEAESGSNHSIRNHDSGAFGLGQWLGPRLAELHRRYGPDPSREQQLDFLLWELRGGDRGGGNVLNSRSAEEALHNYVVHFMRPAAGAETENDLARGRAALGSTGDYAAATPEEQPNTDWMNVDVAGPERRPTQLPDDTAVLESARIDPATGRNVEGDRGPAIGQARAIDFEQFAAEQGASRQGFGDAGMHSPAGDVGRSTRAAQMRRTEEQSAALAQRRNILQTEYDAAVERGEIRPLTSLERLQQTAAGDPDMPATQAAIRVLEKRATREADGTRAAPITATTAEHVEQAAANAEQPTEAQAIAGNYQKGHIRLHGLDITIETARGAERSGTDPNGERWSVTMPAPYGYLKRTTGADEEQVDVYVGPNPQSTKVFVIDQTHADTGVWDEHKGMLGFDSVEQALATYDKAFSDGRARERVGGVTEMDLADFKGWLGSDQTEPIGQIVPQERAAAPPASEAAAEARNQPAAGEAAPAASEGFDPAPHVAALKAYVAKRGRSLAPEAVARALGVTSEQGRRVVGALASQPNSGLFVSKKGNARRIPQRDGPVSLYHFLRDRGGIVDNKDEAKGSRHALASGRNLNRYPGLINNKAGMGLDDALEAAVEAGYFQSRDRQAYSTDDLLQKLEDASREYRPEDGAEADRLRRAKADDKADARAREAIRDVALGLAFTPGDSEAALRYVHDGYSAEEAVDEAMRDAMGDTLADGAEATGNDFYAQVAEDIYEGETAEARGDEAGDQGQGDRGPPEAVAGPEGRERGPGQSGNADAESGGAGAEVAQADAFGLQAGDERRALERRGEGRKRSEATQKPPGSEGGLFDQRDTTRDIEEITGSPIAQARASLQQAMDALDAAETPPAPANDTVPRETPFAVGQDVEVVAGAQVRAATVEETFDVKGEPGVRLRFDDGTFQEDSLSRLKQRGIKVRPVEPVTREAPAQSLLQRAPEVNRRDFIKGVTAVAGGFTVGDRLFAQPPGLMSILERSMQQPVLLAEPLEWIAANSENPQFRRFAARMAPLINGVTIRGARQGEARQPDGTAVPDDIRLGLAHGMHQVDEISDGDVIWLGQGKLVNGLNEGTVIHEGLHAALYRVFGRFSIRMAGNDPALLRREGFNREGAPRPASVADLAELRGIYHDTVAAFERMVEGLSVEENHSDRTRHIRNAIGDPDEFVAYALENRDFQAFLRQQPARGEGPKSLWDRFVDLVRRAMGFGASPRSALDDVLDATYRVLTDPAGPTAEQDSPVEEPTARRVDRGSETGQQRFQRSLTEGENPVFYSALERALKAMSTGRASAAQWTATLTRAAGVKRDELEWSGLLDWLDMQTGPVSREDLLGVVRDGGIKVEEVVLGDPERFDEQALQKEIDKALVDFPEMTAEQATRAAESNLASRGEAGSDLGTQFSEWSSDPSNETYRELLITLPIAEGGNPNRAAATHWDREGVVAHARFMEKTDAAGKRVLFIEEVQSDWHQKGRDEGYEGAAADMDAARRDYAAAKAATLAAKEALITFGEQKGLLSRQWFGSPISRLGFDQQAKALAEMSVEVGGEDFIALGDELRRAELRRTEVTQALHNAERGIPDAPFKSSWPALVMKRMIRYAADAGIERIAWTTGAEQAERYSIERHVQSVRARPAGDGARVQLYFGSNIAADLSRGGAGEHDLSTNSLLVTREQAVALFGKGLGSRIFDEGMAVGDNSIPATIQGLDLRVGGEGMRAFYDRNLVNITNDIIKKYGGKVEPFQILDSSAFGQIGPERRTELGLKPEAEPQINPGFTITPALAKAAGSGFPLFQRPPMQRHAAAEDFTAADYAGLINRLGAEMKSLKIDDKIRLSVEERLRLGDDVAGSYFRGLIRVAYAVSRDPVETISHEAIHALHDFGLFRPSEWTALVKHVRSSPAYMDRIRARYPEVDEATLEEEAIADLYGQWRTQRVDPKGLVGAALRRIADFFKALKAALKGTTTPGQVFRDIEAGRVGSRQSETVKLSKSQMLQRIMRNAFPDANVETAYLTEREFGPPLPRGMKAADYDLFARKVLLDDLVWEDMTGQDLPFGFTSDSLTAAKLKIDRLVDSNEAVRDATRRYRFAQLLADAAHNVDPESILEAEKIEPKEGEPPRAANIRIDKLDSVEDIQTALQTTAEQFGQFGDARRDIVSHEETKRLADSLDMTVDDLMLRRKGQAFNAHELFAAREMLVASANSLVVLARKAEGGSDTDLVNFRRAWVRHVAIQEQVSGLTAEAGRALNQFKLMARAGGDINARMLREILDMEGGRNDVEAVAKAITGFADDPAKLARFARDAFRPTWRDKLFELWINGLLSGPATHVVNTVSNTLTALTQIPEFALASGIGKVRSISNPETDRILRSEVAARATGMIQGAREGARLAAEALRSGEGSDVLSKLEARTQRAISGKKGEIIRVPSRLLIAADELYKGMARRMDLGAQAARIATKEGLSGDEYRARVAGLIADPTDEMVGKAMDFARYSTFQRPLGPMGQAISHVINKVPGLRLVVPFIRTPANIFKFAIARTPAAPVLREVREDIKAGGARRDLALARVLMGSALGATVMMLASAGIITGGDPDDDDARRLLHANGWQPYSIKIGDTYYSFQRLDPLATIMGLAADLAMTHDNMSGPEREGAYANLFSAILNQLKNKTFLSGIGGVIEAIEDPGRFGPAFIGRLAGTVIPTGVAQVNNEIDPVMRDTRQPSSGPVASGIPVVGTSIDRSVAIIESRIPGLSDNLPARRDIWGRVIAREGGVGPDFASPFWTTTDRHDRVAEELLRVGVNVDVPGRRIHGAELPQDDYDRYQEVAGDYLRRASERLIDSRGWANRDDDERRDLFDRVKNRARRFARQRLGLSRR